MFLVLGLVPARPTSCFLIGAREPVRDPWSIVSRFLEGAQWLMVDRESRQLALPI